MYNVLRTSVKLFMSTFNSFGTNNTVEFFLGIIRRAGHAITVGLNMQYGRTEHHQYLVSFLEETLDLGQHTQIEIDDGLCVQT